jgi:glycosyltransferase involved in cell wall biosynthesis
MNVWAIIACHNGEKFVAEAIRSIQNQSVECGIAICNDGSSDGSHDVIMTTLFDGAYLSRQTDNGLIYQNSKAVYIHGDRCKGASEARNICMGEVWDKATHFLIQDADDVSYPNKVEKMLTKFFPGVAAVYADYHIYREHDGLTVCEYKKPYSLEALSKECIVHSQAMISKSALEQVFPNRRPYDPSLHGPATEKFIGCSEDYLLWLCLAHSGFMLWHVPEFLSKVRVHGNNASKIENVTQEVWARNQQIIQRRLQEIKSGQKV